tara:strand:- start:400 stop:2901 length:2502 start_codon:yes stop_codon:yes gene_type:complete
MPIENQIIVSVTSKDTAKIVLALSDDSNSNFAVSAVDISPVIKFIPTGPAGPSGGGISEISDGFIDTNHIKNSAVTFSKLANNSVSFYALQTNSVSSGKIQANAITSTKIQNGAVTFAKLSNNSVGPDQIIDGTVTKELLADGIIDTDKLEDLIISTAKLKNGCVTGIKIEQNPTIQGEIRADHYKAFGTSPATFEGPDTDDLIIKSNDDLIFIVDNNETTTPGANSFIFKNGAGVQVASIDESGNLTILGNVDGIDIATDVAANTAKVGITTSQANAITANTAKTSFPGFGTTAGTALEGNTVIPTVPTLIDSDTMTGASSTNIASAESIKAYVDNEVSGIVDSAPSTLNTLNELADALGDDANFSTTVTNNIATKQPILSEGAFADGDKTKLDGIATGATASPDLTVDGAGTIHANNVPTLNQNTTGNAATATALTSGNKIIQGELEVQGNLLFSTTDGDPQHIRDAQDTDVITITDGGLTTLLAAGNLDIGSHDFRAESFTSDAATGQPPFTVSSTTEVANLRAATASALASGDQTINGNLAVTGTVDGIDIATDVAANTAKTSFPGFGTTAGTALEGDTTIPTQYTDADAVSAVAAADDYLKNDTNEVLAGSLEINSQLFINKPDGTSKTRFRNIATTSNKTLDVPDESGTIMLRGNAHQVMQVSLRDHVDYMFYMFNHNYWYSAGASTLAILGNSASPSNITAANSEYQSRVAAYTAVENCILQKMVLNFYWSSSAISGDADLEFAFSKFTPIQDGTAAIITINDITATDCDDAYTEAKPYQKTFEFSGNNATLSAGDAFGFHMRTINSQNSQRVLVYASAVLQIRLT